MAARILRKTLFSVGHYYFAEDIEEIRPFLKLVSAKQNSVGHYYLYRNRQSQDFWILGPHRSNNKMMFYYLGKKELLLNDSNFSKEFQLMMQDLGSKFWSAILPSESYHDLEDVLINKKSRQIKRV